MPLPSRRVVLAGVLTAAAVAVPVVALASGPDSPGAPPAHLSTTLEAKRAKAEAAKSADSSTSLKAKRAKAAAKSAAKSAAAPSLQGLASSAGISRSRLDAGLAAAKRARGNNPAGIAAFARATGVSPATAQRIVATAFGK